MLVTMTDELTFIVLVSGLPSNSTELEDGGEALQSYLLLHFALDSNIKPIHFHTVTSSSGSITPCHPNITDSAVNLLQTLQDAKDQQENMNREIEKQITAEEEEKAKYRLIFCAQNMGGFVAKKALVLASQLKSFHWIAMGTTTTLFFETPQVVPELSNWETIVIKLLANSNCQLNFLSFLQYIPERIAHLETLFFSLSGSYHIVNFLTTDGHRSVVTKDHVREPFFNCDRAVMLDCESHEIWSPAEDRPWSDPIHRAVRKHMRLDSKVEAMRYLSLRFAQMRLELRQLYAPFHSWAASTTPTWIIKDWCANFIEDNRSRVLNIAGSTGSGKKAVAEEIANRFRSAQMLVLSYSVDEKGKPIDLLRSFCQQALLSPTILGRCERLCSWLTNGDLFTESTFTGLLHSIFSTYRGRGICCIIHGITNYDQNAQSNLLTILHCLKDVHEKKVKILMTGNRDKQHRVAGFDNTIDLNNEIENDARMKTSAEMQMKQLAVEQPIWGTLKAKEIEGMWTNSNTLYELTQKVSFLRSSRPSTPQEVNTLVSSIPATFAHFFDFLETRIGFMKRQILDWITYSVRPMTLSELAVCIALDEVQTITANDLRNYTPWEIQTYLEHSLGQIIKITGETVVIRHSLYEQQILSKPRSIENVHLLLLRKCINYLRAIEDSWKPEKEFERENRMAGYAALHWPEHYHCAVATSVEESCGSVLLLFESEKSLKAWLNVVSFHDRVSNEPIKLPQTAISSASRFGLTAVVERLLDSHQGEEDLESQCVAALETAAKYGHIGVIRLLVDRGVRSEQALVGAACFGDIATTTELLKTHKQFLDSRGGQEGAYTPILQAALLGHLDTFALLLAEGADVEALTPETKWSALHLSARIGQIAIVRLLVHKRASLGLSDYKGYTALAHAADAGFSDVVRELIKGNVSDILPEVAENQQSLFVNPQNDERDTPLHLAASHGHSQVVQILLQNGAKPQMRNKIGYTPLHLAVVGGFDDITKTLLGSGTQDLCSTVATNILPVQEIEDDYKVPSLLELAVESQNLDTIKTLRYSALPVNELLLSPALEMACRLASHECVLYLLEWHHDRSDVGESLTTKDGNTALHLAAQNGDSALFIELLETSFADIDIDNQEGNTPLAEAAISGSLPILQRFCNDPRLSGAMSDGTERTIFHLAAKSGHVHIVKWLMTFSEHKRDRVTDLEQTAVFIAAKNGHQCVVKFLLESKYSVASGALLHLVIQRGWVDVAKQIISTAETAVVNWRDLKTGKTALHLAIGTGRADLVQLLLELVADPNQKDEAGFVPFATAMKSDHLDIVRVFLDSSRDIYFDGSGSADVTPLLRACEEGPNKIPFLKELLEKQSSGVNMNAKWPVEDDSSHVGDTPLVLASLHLDTDWEGGYALLNLLLSFGSDPNVPDARGNTALFVAAELGHYKALKSLLDNRADPKIKNDRGSTALHRCSQSGYVECIEELLKHGALINAAKRPKDDQLSGITPLLIAVAQSEKAAVDKLLEHGAEIGRSVHVAAMTGEAEIAETLFQKLDDPNVYDGEFGTPLHAAVACSNDEMVKFILALRGIDVNITGPAGRTALGIAASITEGEDIVKYLVDAQADPNIRDHEGKTPLDHAIIEEETEIVKYLCDHTRLDLSEAGVRNHSPLYLACQTGKIDIFEVVNSASKSLGESEYRDLCELSLHATIAAGKPKFLDQLISQSGVMGNMEDDDGWTALKYATNYLQSEMKEQVLKKLKENELHENTQQTDQTVAKMPRAWHTKDRHPALYRQHESTTGEVMITTKLHEVQPAGEDDFAAVRADHCIPADEDYYFEVAIVKGHDKGGLDMGIGLCDDASPVNRMLGFGRRLSFGYHSDDGCTYSSISSTLNLYEKSRSYGEGSIVGCGFDASTKCIYFTKDGEQLEERFDEVRGKLYPAVFLNTRQEGVCVSATFPSGEKKQDQPLGGGSQTSS